MKIKFSEIPPKMSIDDFPDDTVFVLDDRPPKRNPITGRAVLPDDPEYDSLPMPKLQVD